MPFLSERVLLLPVALFLALATSPPAHAQDCDDVGRLRSLAQEHDLDGANLAALQARVCQPRVLLSSPTCEELTIMDLLARFDAAEAPRSSRTLTQDQQRELAQARRDACAPANTLHAHRHIVTTWANGRVRRQGPDILLYPNGRVARSGKGTWDYPTGRHARTTFGKWRYPNNRTARTNTGTWFTPEGDLLAQPRAVQQQACQWLGPELCPFGKADEDLLTAAMIGVLCEAAEQRESEGDSP